LRNCRRAQSARNRRHDHATPRGDPSALTRCATLNVLLSFAQFEREVTSERIRDKIAASKRKGLWVGGMVPLK